MADKKITTKELARHLGLLKRRSSSLSTISHKKDVANHQKSSNDVIQTFSYVIILDFESTCWKDKSTSYPPEIIEFPAVLLNLCTGEVESKFQYYVQPSEHRKLSAFCTELTGITQDTVDNGIPLRTCLKLFDNWVVQQQTKKQFSFNVGATKTCTLVTWTDWDLNVCLQYECKRKHISYPCYLKTWMDLKRLYKEFYGRQPKGLFGALEDLGIKFFGREHSGIDDATNTAYLAWRMVKDGCLMKITKSLVLSLKDRNDDQIKVEESTKTKDLHDLKLTPQSDCVQNKLAATSTAPPKETVKITPPLCSCGRRCKQKKVVNPGRNFDRTFYTCPVQTAIKMNNGNRKGCEYFEWKENVLKENRLRNAKLPSTENFGVVDVKRAKPEVEDNLLEETRARNPKLQSTETLNFSAKRVKLDVNIAQTAVVKNRQSLKDAYMKLFNP